MLHPKFYFNIPKDNIQYLNLVSRLAYSWQPKCWARRSIRQQKIQLEPRSTMAHGDRRRDARRDESLRLLLLLDDGDDCPLSFR